MSIQPNVEVFRSLWIFGFFHFCDIFYGSPLGWPKKHKNGKFENVPLSCGYLGQVEKKSLKDCIVLINIQPALCRLKSLIPLYKAKKKVFQSMSCGDSKLVPQGA